MTFEITYINLAKMRKTIQYYKICKDMYGFSRYILS